MYGLTCFCHQISLYTLAGLLSIVLKLLWHKFHTMGKLFETITPQLQEWISAQKIFFVATAPLSANGHINCSPKGLDSLRIIGPNTVLYRDLTGSGIETIAHLKENGRIVLMFCAFDGPPKIVRIHGKGEVIEPGHPAFNEMSSLFAPHAGTRAFIKITAARISDSCGYAVPLMEFKNDRDVLDKWTANKGEDGLKIYHAEKNMQSIDGLPGLG